VVLSADAFHAGLFNLRGGDIQSTPVFFSYSIVTMDECHLFLNEKKITDEGTSSP
jgi:Xaa-Pro aminopeptidase